MRLNVRHAILAGVGLGLAAGSAAAADLALKRVMLSNGGIAYYEHEAVVEGDDVLKLDVRLNQIDDVLKSLVVYDDKGAVGAIRLPGRQPLGEIFRDLPFAETDLASPAQLLARLQGAEIEVLGPRAVKGSILSVVEETVRGPDKVEATQHRVTVVSDEGVHQFVLEEAGSFRFSDEKLAREVRETLLATARHRVMDRRTLEIEVRGSAKRPVRVGYVVGAPVWKTTYRLTVTEGNGKGLLQGWAVLENQSGHDWRDVELTLVSGNPVTFRQALYESYYVARPEVPLDVAGRIIPPVDTGSIARLELRDTAAKSAREMPMESRSYGAAPPSPAPIMVTPGAARPAERATTTEAPTQLLFRMPRPVSVTAGNSLVVPVIHREIPAARIALFERRTNASNPLIAIRLTNDGATTLPSGIFTVYEREKGDAAVAFVGDARVGILPKGEERFASFALDPKIRIDEERSASKAFRQAGIGKGVLSISTVARETTLYRIAGPAEGMPPVVIQHPRKDGWTLVEPDPKTVPMSPTTHRVMVSPAPGGTAQVSVVLERIENEGIAIADLGSERLVAYSQEGALPQPLKNALKEAARLKSVQEGFERTIKALEKERNAIVEDQERVRENLTAAPAGSDLQRRYQKKLNEQENRLDAIDGKLAENTAKAAKAAEDLATFIASLNL